MDPSKMDSLGSKSGGGGFHANEEFGAADQQSSSSATNTQQSTVATAVQQVAHVGIDPVGPQCSAVTNRGNLFPWDVGMMQPNVLPFHLEHVSLSPLAPPPTADLNMFQFPAVQVAHVGIDPVGPQCSAVTNRSNLFQTSAHPQPLHNSPANGWARHHPQLKIVEPCTLVNGSHARATPHTAIAKFPLSHEKPYYEVTISDRRGEMSIGLCAKSAPINKRFDHGLHSNISPFTATDVIGCGVLFTERVVVVIYTINGQRMGKRIMKGDDVMSELYPFVTLEGPQDSIEANFEGKFTYEFKTED